MRYLTCFLVLSLLVLSLAAADSRAADPIPPATQQLLEAFVSEFVLITPGVGDFPSTFQLGSVNGPPTEQPVVEVVLKEPFAIAKFEMTQNLYEAVIGQNPSRWKGPRNSVEMVNWHEARTCCERLTTLLRQAKLIAADEVIRLPSEAEWEYCCRAGTTTQYSFGNVAQAENDVAPRATLLDPYGWHTGNAAGNDPPVGALKPNAWGLYDMHGYLSEFCLDDWQPDFADHSQTPLPRTVKGAEQCVTRSGSWKDSFENLRSSARKPVAKQQRDDALGFRCLRAKVAQ